MKIVHFRNILNHINKQNIVIIGHMGSGKSVFGKKIAKYFDVKHVDTDREIIKLEKAPINEIFLNNGEEYFREIETKIVLKVLNKKNIIISLGGGSILNRETRNELKRKCYTVFLDVDINVLIKRLNYSQNRPLLKDSNILTKINQLDQQRRKHYLNADLIIDNSDSISETLSTFKRIFFSLND